MSFATLAGAGAGAILGITVNAILTPGGELFLTGVTGAILAVLGALIGAKVGRTIATR